MFTPTSPFLLVGLGNPGREYANNRHNVGFMVADAIAKKLGVEFSRVQSNTLVVKGEHEGNKVILAKPRTFMNLSGNSVASLVRFYKVELDHLLVIYDEVDLPFHTLRLRPDGSSAGHKGITSIIERLGTDGFPRLRVGIGRPPGRKATPSHVLEDFSKAERAEMLELLDRAASAALKFITNGIESAMNEYNRIEP